MLCWGWNRYGQCAVEGEDAVTAARSAGDDAPAAVVDAVASAFDTVVVDGRGAAYRCGRGANSARLVRLAGLPSRVIRVAAGRDFACAVLVDCRVACWGDNARGQCAAAGGGFVAADSPRVVDGCRGAEIAAGLEFAVAATPEGAAHSWGALDHGQLGRPGAGVAPLALDARPAALRGVVGVACGDHHALLLDRAGRVASFGLAEFGRLGRPAAAAKLPGRVRFLGGAAAVAVAAGGASSAAVDAAGRLWTWGCNGSGQLGDGTRDDAAEPRLARFPGRCAAVDLGEDHAVAADGDGALWAWGSGRSGRLGAGDRSSPAPARVRAEGAGFAALAGAGAARVSAGGAHAVAWSSSRPQAALREAEARSQDASDVAAAVAAARLAAADAAAAAAAAVAAADDATVAVAAAERRKARESVERRRRSEARRRRERDAEDARRREEEARRREAEERREAEDDALGALVASLTPRPAAPATPPRAVAEIASPRSSPLATAATHALSSPPKQDWASLQAEFASLAAQGADALHLADRTCDRSTWATSERFPS